MAMPDSSTVTAIVPSPANHTSGITQKLYILLHDIECPPGLGWAVSLAGPGYMQNPGTMASVNYIVDAADTVQTAPENVWVWGSGTPSSQHGIHIEQAGYASFTREQWLGIADVDSTYVRPNNQTYKWSEDNNRWMAAQYSRVVALVADIVRRNGWKPQAATADDLQAMVNGNWRGTHARHRDASVWVGGTNHTDPGNYPWDKLWVDVADTLNGTTPDPEPTPEPEPDMPLSKADAQLVAKELLDNQFTTIASYPPSAKGKEVAVKVTVRRAIQSAATYAVRGLHSIQSRPNK